MNVFKESRQLPAKQPQARCRKREPQQSGQRAPKVRDRGSILSSLGYFTQKGTLWAPPPVSPDCVTLIRKLKILELSG